MKNHKFGYAVAALAAAGAFSEPSCCGPAGSDIEPAVMAQSLNCDMSQYKAASGLTAAIEQDALAVTWNGANSSERSRALCDRQRPARRPRAGRPQVRRPVGAARAEPRARVLRQERRAAHDDAARRAAHQSRRRHHAGGDREEQVVLVLGRAVRHSRGCARARARTRRGSCACRRPRARAAGTGIAERAGGEEGNGAARPERPRLRTSPQTRGDPKCERDVQDHILQREHRRRESRGRTSRGCRWGSSLAAFASRPTAARTCFGWKRSRRPTSSRSLTSTKGD